MRTSVHKAKASMAIDVKFSREKICVGLKDGRQISAPLGWFPKLKGASPKQRKNWRLIGGASAFTGRSWTGTFQSQHFSSKFGDRSLGDMTGMGHDPILLNWDRVPRAWSSDRVPRISATLLITDRVPLVPGGSCHLCRRRPEPPLTSPGLEA
jgi:hypothetical protein